MPVVVEEQSTTPHEQVEWLFNAVPFVFSHMDGLEHIDVANVHLTPVPVISLPQV